MCCSCAQSYCGGTQIPKLNNGERKNKVTPCPADKLMSKSIQYGPKTDEKVSRFWTWTVVHVILAPFFSTSNIQNASEKLKESSKCCAIVESLQSGWAVWPGPRNPQEWSALQRSSLALLKPSNSALKPQPVFYLGMPTASLHASIPQQHNLGADITNNLMCSWKKKLWDFLKGTILLK